MSYFKKENIENNFHFNKEINKVPYNGFSFYKINYQGDWPESLKEAYAKMMEFNKKSPRNKFKASREKVNQ